MIKLLTIAKALIGSGVAAALIPAVNTIAENPVIWSWEHMLGAAFGVGISVYLVPNKNPTIAKTGGFKK